MNSIFTNEEINHKRQHELDLAKGLAIIFMVWVHTNEYFQGTAYHGGVYNRIVEFLGSPPSAPVFMILLGVGIVYSRKNSPKELFKRGISLFISGYIVSFLRDMIPYYLLYKVEGDSELLTEASYLLWGTDILQFAGLTFVFFAAVKYFKLSNKALFGIWCAFATLNMIFRGTHFDTHMGNVLGGLFFGTDDYSWFPFLNWVSFPMVGYVFGQYLIRCVDKRKFYQQILIVSSLISVPLWIYSYVNNIQFGAFGELWQQAYYHHDIIGTFVLISFAFFWISLCYFAVPYVPAAVQKLMAKWSRRTNNIYSISYIILGFSMLAIETESCHPAMVCFLAVIIFIASNLVCAASEKINQMLKYRINARETGYSNAE